MSIFITLSLLFSSLAFAQIKTNYAYKLDGTYMLESSVIRPVKFSLRWNEKDGKIDGIYLDNYFTRTTDIRGSARDSGRSFTVPLEAPVKGVKTIHILSGHTAQADSATTVPMSIITRDIKGNPLTTVESEGQIISLAHREELMQEQEAECEEGFGKLAGYCGLYGGMISQNIIPGQECNLLRSNAVRLELTTDGEFLLHLDRNPVVVNRPAHYIGRIGFNPQSNGVDVLSRSCRPLADVNFPGDNCKILNLVGTLSRKGNDRHFEGSYVITDEATKRSCKYNLSLDMQD